MPESCIFWAKSNHACLFPYYLYQYNNRVEQFLTKTIGSQSQKYIWLFTEKSANFTEKSSQHNKTYKIMKIMMGTMIGVAAV